MPPPGGVPEWPKGTGCKPVGSAFGGSNPPSPTCGWSEPAAAPSSSPRTGPRSHVRLPVRSAQGAGRVLPPREEPPVVLGLGVDIDAEELRRPLDAGAARRPAADDTPIRASVRCAADSVVARPAGRDPLLDRGELAADT